MGVKFTPREIDVIACLLSGKGSKTIASFLSIEEKTVETHKYNVMRKLECNTKEGIIHFIEQSDKFSALKYHYLSLLREAIFEKYLRQILSLSNMKGMDCLLVYEQSKNFTSLINQLEKHLALAGVKVVKEARENHKSMNHLIHYAHSCEIDSIAYLVPESSLKKIRDGDNHAILEIAEVIQKHEHAKGKVVFLLEREEPLLDIPQEIKDTGYIGLGGHENYYFCVLDILQILLPDINLEKTISNFKRQYETGYDSFENSSSQQSTNENDISEAEYLKRNSVSRNLKKRKWGLIVGCSLILSFGCLLFTLNFKNENKVILRNPAQNTQTIRSDLPIPTDNVFLHRPELMKQIEEKLQGEQDIQTIAIVGIGGSGKTTIARQYARQQKSPIVWEINAETKAGLVESFEKLANDLAKTEENKRLLRRLMEVKEPNMREEEIIRFVKGHLREGNNWILIYDNVEKFSDVEKYFPKDSGVWGKGKIIVTTRDSNIQNNSHIKNTISVGELGVEERIKLFQNIMGKSETNSMKYLSKGKVIQFLDELPPFPLDISLAAFYLKTTNIPYQRYLENIKVYHKEFNNTQEKLLEEASIHKKTRYNVIALSLEQLISVNKEFEDLLLFISMLDSQDIPRGLLDSYKNSAIVDNFIYNLKKYSFIINGQPLDLDPIPSLSIHRSTQVISLSYLAEILDVKKKSLSFSKALESYIAKELNKANYSTIKILARHCEVFLTHRDLLLNINVGSIEGKLGSIYFYQGNYIAAKQILEESLQKLNKNHTKDRYQISEIFVFLGMIYRKIGDYENAKSFIKQSLLIYEKDFPNNHFEYCWSLANLGIIYRELGEYEKAKNLLEQSLVVFKKYLSKDYVGIAGVLAQLGNIYRYLENYEEAETLLKHSIALYKKKLPENHIEVAWSLLKLGNVYRCLGKYKEAESLLLKSLVVYKNYYGEDHIEIYWVLAYIAKLYRDLGQYEKAKNLLQQSLIANEKFFGKDHISVAWILQCLGRVYKMEGKNAKAISIFNKSLKIYEKRFGKNNVVAARIFSNLSQVYIVENNMEMAEKCMIQALQIFQKNKCFESIKVLERLAELYLKKSTDLGLKYMPQSRDFIKIATNYQTQALAAAKSHFLSNSPHILRVQAKLTDIEKALVSSTVAEKELSNR